MPTPEQHFACFRAEGRADALAAVFDALAPELLLVAAHLARGGVQAEDLVQATFVDAIRGAARWDETRPLLPWLLGILTRNALAESRRTARQPDPLRVAAPRGEPLPPDEAAARELADRVAAVVQELPLVYRQVLSLRLAHGLSVGEIAHALGCPVATVKTRLLRGLERLRGSLPAGFVAPGAVWFAPGRGLPAVREVVLEMAQTAASVVPIAAAIAPVGIVIGTMAMKKLAFLACGLVLALGMWGAWPDAPASAPNAVAPAPALAALAAGEGGVVARAPIEASTAPVAAGLLPIVIEGRCLAEEDGAPVGDAAATLRAGTRGAMPSQTWSTVTRADGRFVLTFPPRAGDEVVLDVRGEGRVSRSASWSEPGAGTRIDLGDVRLARGHRVAGVVVDAAGRPMPGVELRLQGAAAVPIAGSAWRSGRGRADATTGDDGRFAFPDAIQAGAWNLDSLTGGIVVQEPRVVHLPREGELRVVAQRFGAVRGVAFDAAGAPAAGVVLVARVPGSGEHIGSARTAGDGRFRVFAHREGVTEIEVVPQGDEFRSDGAVPRFAVGSEGVRVVLERAPAMAIDVVDAETGDPVEAFAVFLTSEKRGSSEDLRPAARHAGGRASVPGLRPGRNVLRIVPTDEAYAVSEPAIVVMDGVPPPPHRVELRRRVPRTVRVVDDRGAAVPGARLSLEAHRSPGIPLPARDPRRGLSGFGSDFERRWPELVDRALSGVDGAASVQAALGARDLTLRVETEGYLRTEVRDLIFDRGAPDIEVRLARGGAIEGRVLLAGIEANRVRIELVPVAVPGLDHELESVGVAGDGTFQVAGLLAGEYELVPALATSMGHGNGNRGLFLGGARGRVKVSLGTPARVVLDATASAPGRARGRVTFVGVPTSRLVVSLIGTGPRPDGFGPFCVDVEGNWHADEILPGAYVVQVGMYDLAGSEVVLRCPIAETFDVRTGATAERDVVLVRGVLRGRIVDASGAPVAEAFVAVETDTGETTLCSGSTSSDGAFVFDPMPTGHWHLAVHAWTLTPSVVEVRAVDSAAMDPPVVVRAEPARGPRGPRRR